MPSDWEDEEGLPEGERPSEERVLPEDEAGLPEMRPDHGAAAPGADPRADRPPPADRDRRDRRGRGRGGHRAHLGGRRSGDKGTRQGRRGDDEEADGKAEAGKPRGHQRDPAGRLEALQGPGADPRVPRARRPAGRRALPGTVRRPHRLRKADGLAGRTRIRGGDARTGAGSLVPQRQTAAETGRHLLRRRLPPPVHLRPADPAQTRLGGRAQPEGGRLGTVRIERQGDDRGGLGAGRPHDPPPRPDRTRRRKN